MITCLKFTLTSIAAFILLELFTKVLLSRTIAGRLIVRTLKNVYKVSKFMVKQLRKPVKMLISKQLKMFKKQVSLTGDIKDRAMAQSINEAACDIENYRVDGADIIDISDYLDVRNVR